LVVRPATSCTPNPNTALAAQLKRPATEAINIALGDFNGDGKQDIAAADNDFPNPGSVSILSRDCGL
jgi:hypothetical protein